MRQPRSQIALAALALLLGFLLVVQVRAQQAGTGLEAQSSQDLTLLIANLTTRSDSLRAELADLQRQLDAMSAARARGETSVGQLRVDLERVRVWAGLEPAAGPGVRIAIGGPVPAVAIADVVNELRNVGAEAIAIDGVRVVAGSAIAGPVGGLSIDNTPLARPVEIIAIGYRAHPHGRADPRRRDRRPGAGLVRGRHRRGDTARRRRGAGDGADSRARDRPAQALTSGPGASLARRHPVLRSPG